MDKNIELFTYQLGQQLPVEAQALRVIEWRNDCGKSRFLRWRFQWLGRAVRSAEAEPVAKAQQHSWLASLLSLGRSTCLHDYVEKGLAA